MTDPALQLSGIRKRFRPLVVLDTVDLVARKGTIDALPGENGAGKTTLIRVTIGLTMPNERVITVDGGVVVVFGRRAREVARNRDAVGRAMLRAA